MGGAERVIRHGMQMPSRRAVCGVYACIVGPVSVPSARTMADGPSEAADCALTLPAAHTQSFSHTSAHARLVALLHRGWCQERKCREVFLLLLLSCALLKHIKRSLGALNNISICLGVAGRVAVKDLTELLL